MADMKQEQQVTDQIELHEVVISPSTDATEVRTEQTTEQTSEPPAEEMEVTSPMKVAEDEEDLDEDEEYVEEPLKMLASLDHVLIKQPFRTKEFLWDLFGKAFKKIADKAGFPFPFAWIVTRAYQVFVTLDESKERPLDSTVDGKKVKHRKKDRQILMNIKEDSNCCYRQLMKVYRPLTLTATDPAEKKKKRNKHERDEKPPMVEFHKKGRNGFWCCSATSCLGCNYMEVVMNGQLIGSIREDWSFCRFKVKYEVYDNEENLLCTAEQNLLHRAPIISLCRGDKYEIFDADEQSTGKSIQSQNAGNAVCKFQMIRVEFPECMDSVPNKVLLIGAAMLIDYRQWLIKATGK